jgi:hypothetical protein
VPDEGSELEDAINAALRRGDVQEVLALAEELLFGMPRLLSGEPSASAIRALHQIYAGGDQQAGFMLVGLSFEELSDILPITLNDWLALLIAKARSGDPVAIGEIEHLPLNIMPAEEAQRLARELRKTR